MKVGISVFIQGVSRDALRCASKSRSKRTDDEMVATDTPENDTFAHCLGSHGSAFRNLSCMPRKASWKAAQDRQGSVQGGIAAASSKDKVSASFQRTLQWLDAHHADHPHTAVDYPFIHGRCRLQGSDPFLPK